MREMTLKIASNLTLPVDLVTESIGILAKRRAGKSYTARRFVEQLHKAGEQVVIIDPKGDWWGLIYGKDGKSPGLPFVLCGGEHGHVPIESGAGEVVARLVVEKRVSLVLDLSFFRKHEVATFTTAFLETLYRLKAREQYRDAVMLVIDEADAIAPQKPPKGHERMLGAAEDLVRRGGQRGIGVTMITQRSAVLNKNVLTQIGVLITLRTIAPQDRKAVDDWIEVHGTTEQRAVMMASLASLPTGTAWVWSPGADIFKRVEVLPIETFDSFATPKAGERRIEPKNAADVDLGAFTKEMAATIERAKADDPKELRKEIADLKRQLASSAKAAPAPAPTVERIEVPVLKGEELKRAETVVERLGWILEKQEAQTAAVREELATVKTAIARAAAPASAAVASLPSRPSAAPASLPSRGGAAQPSLARRAGASTAPHGNGSSAPLPVGERRVLTACAQYTPPGCSREQVSILTGYKRSTRDAYIQRLGDRGYLDVSGGVVAATAEGFAALGPAFEPLPTGDALRAYWLERLPEGERKVLDAACSVYPGSVEREWIGEETGYKRSTRDAYIQRLQARRLVNSEGRGAIRASEELFG